MAFEVVQLKNCCLHQSGLQFTLKHSSVFNITFLSVPANVNSIITKQFKGHDHHRHLGHEGKERQYRTSCNYFTNEWVSIVTQLSMPGGVNQHPSGTSSAATKPAILLADTRWQ
jgi:hypothetical protein